MTRFGPAGLLLPRVAGALSLRVATFHAVSRDSAAGLQAGILVVVVGVIEASVDAAIHGPEATDSIVLLGWVLAALIGWALWSGIVWLVGVRILDHPIEFPAIVRGLAFAHATSLPYGLAAIPVLTPWAGLVYATTLVWFTAALYAAIRGIFDVPPRAALKIFALAIGIRVLVLEVFPYALRLIPRGLPS